MKRGTILIVDRSRLFREGIKEVLRRASFCVAAQAGALGAARGRPPGARALVRWPRDCSDDATAEADLACLRRTRSQWPTIRFVALVEEVSRKGVARALAAGVDAFLSNDISGQVLARSLDLVILGQQFFPPELAKLLATCGLAEPCGNADVAEGCARLPAPDGTPEFEAVAMPRPSIVQINGVQGNAAPGVHADGGIPVRTAPVAGAGGRIGFGMPHQAIAGRGDRALGDRALGDRVVGNRVLGDRAAEKEISLSERESQILQYLVGGSSNKAIARELTISEATVKVHVKGLLRKVRVTNRTQAAIWAINHYDRPSRIA